MGTRSPYREPSRGADDLDLDSAVASPLTSLGVMPLQRPNELPEESLFARNCTDHSTRQPGARPLTPRDSALTAVTPRA